MTTKNARTLDVIVTAICAGTRGALYRVYYGFPVGEPRIEYADIYPEGGFDICSIEVGKRYLVQTAKRPCRVLNEKMQDYEVTPRFVWLYVQEQAPNARVAARSQAQRVRAELAASKPIANPGLFGF